MAWCPRSVTHANYTYNYILINYRTVLSLQIGKSTQLTFSYSGQRVSAYRNLVKARHRNERRALKASDAFRYLPRCSPRDPGARSRCARNPPRARLYLREAETPNPK